MPPQKRHGLSLPPALLTQLEGVNSKDWSASHNLGGRLRNRKEARKEQRQAKRHNKTHSQSIALPTEHQGKSKAPGKKQETQTNKGRAEPPASKKRRIEQPSFITGAGAADRETMSREEMEEAYYAKKLGIKNHKRDLDLNGDLDELLGGLDGLSELPGEDIHGGSDGEIEGLDASEVGSEYSNEIESGTSDSDSDGGDNPRSAKDTMAALARAKGKTWQDSELSDDDFDSEGNSDDDQDESVEQTMAALKAAKASKPAQSTAKQSDSIKESSFSDDDELSEGDFDSNDEEDEEGEQSAEQTMAALKALKARKQKGDVSKSKYDDSHDESDINSDEFNDGQDMSGDDFDSADFESDDDNEQRDSDEMTADQTMAALKALKAKKSRKPNANTDHEDPGPSGTDELEEDSDSSSSSESDTSHAPSKYVPPSKRGKSTDNIEESEDVIRLRRLINGSLNRLAEANLGSIVEELRNMFVDYPRPLVTRLLGDLILVSVQHDPRLQEPFLAVRAGVVSALYKSIGVDFGAAFIQRLVTEFERKYADGQGPNASEQAEGSEDEANRRAATNLLLLLVECYAVHIVSARLMYDMMRQFLSHIESETSVELLLAVVRHCGPQLRSDDPESLKEVILLLQQKMAGRDVSARVRFLVECIVALKNNRHKPVSETLMGVRQRVRKFLGGLPEPLHVSLDDIRNADTKGKWWIVGAAWKGRDQEQNHDAESDPEGVAELLADEPNWAELARKQRLNTDIRRAVFTALMGAEDYLDACLRLDKLRLKSRQEREVPAVILHCCARERAYNPFYALVAAKQCTNYQTKRTLQFRLWDLLRELEDGTGNTRATMHLSRFYASLVLQGAMSLDALRVANFLAARGNLQVFLEVFFVTVYKTLGKQAEQGKRRGIDGELVRDGRELARFLATAKDRALLRGIQYFQPKLLSSEILDARSKPRVAWCVELANDLVDQLASKTED